MDTKVCSKCGVEKPFSEYYKHKKGKYGLQAQCKKCHTAQTSAHIATEKGKAVQRKYYMSDRAKAKAKERNASPEQVAKRQAWRDSEEGKAIERKRYLRRKASFKIQAKSAVYCAVESGELPRIHTLVCAECGKQAQHYHHKSYAKEDWLTVTPLCASCHKLEHSHD